MAKPVPWKKYTKFMVASCVLVLCACGDQETPASPHGLRAPFDVSVIRQQQGKAQEKAFKCKDIPPPLKDLYFSSVYDKGSANASLVDPEAEDDYLEKTKPIRTFESGLANIANSYVLSRPADTGISDCAVSWLKSWTQAGGLLGEENATGIFVRKWALSAISLAYLQIRDEPSIAITDHISIKTWIRNIAQKVIEDFSVNTDKKSRNNNHMYWAAWGVMSAAAALDDRDMFAWGLQKAQQGIDQIQEDGTLPLEMARGKKAYHYHHYAAIPLFMMANMAKENGTDLYARNDNALERLARVLLENIEDPAYFEKLTGEKQDLERTISASNLVWLEVYYKHTKDANALPWLEKFRPVKHSRVGGNATVLYSDQ